MSEPHIALGADGHAVAAWIDGVSWGGHVVAEYGRAGGRFARVRISRLGDTTPLGGPLAAVDGNGQATVVWNDRNGHVQFARKPPQRGFTRPVVLAGAERVIALRASVAGTLLVTAVPDGDDTYAGTLSAFFAPPGGGFGPPQQLGHTVSFLDVALGLDDLGRAIAFFHDQEGLVISRGTTAGGFGPPQLIESVAPDQGYATPLAAGISGDGSAVVLWTTFRVWMAQIAPDGSRQQPVQLSTDDRPGSTGDLAVDERGDAAVVWGAPGFSVFGAYRPAGGAFGPPRPLSRHALRGAPDVALDSGGNALVLAQLNDAITRRERLTRFGRIAPTTVADLLRVPSFRRSPSGRRDCHPPGATILLHDREADVFRIPTRNASAKYGCLYASGRRFRIDPEDTIVHGPPTMALAGPLVAYYYDSLPCGACNDAFGINVVDLRTDEPANGVSPDGPLYVGPFSFISIVMRRDGAIAWIDCDADDIRLCHHAGPKIDADVFELEPGASDPERLDTGTGIDPTSLRLRGSRITWRDGGETRGARLR